MSENNSTSDWLYILLTLVAAGLSLIKSLSQKNKNISEHKQSESEINSGELFEDTMIVGNTNELIKEEMEYSFIPEEEGGEKIIIKNSANTQWSEEEDTEIEDADFELKKAIVYNEILNRKYE